MKTTEQLRQEFPQMPDFIGEMIMAEVARQISGDNDKIKTAQTKDSVTKTGRGQKSRPLAKEGRGRRRGFLAGTGILTRAAVILAAILVCGTTAYAAVKLYLQYNKDEAYSATIALSGGSLQKENTVPTEVAAVTLTIGYMPEGLVPQDKGESSFISETEDYGYAIGEPLFADSADPLHVSFLQEIELVSVNGRDGLYTRQNFSDDPTWYWQRVYVLYPEVHRIVSVVGWGRASREELLQIAEGITLVETGETVPASSLPAWSEAVANLNEQYAQLTEAAGEGGNGVSARLTATTEEMRNLHRMGEAFPVTPNKSLYAAVTDVQIYDDFSPLTRKDRIPESWPSLLDENGKIGSAVMTYIKPGDGTRTMNETVGTKEQPMKLVCVTVEYQNRTDQDMEEVWFCGALMALEEENGAYRILADEEADGTYGTYLDHSMIGPCEMAYYDVTGGARNNNYIPEIGAHESTVVHMAWLVEEEKLDKLFLSVNGDTGYEFTDAELETGLVDLRK